MINPVTLATATAVITTAIEKAKTSDDIAMLVAVLPEIEKSIRSIFVPKWNKERKKILISDPEFAKNFRKAHLDEYAAIMASDIETTGQTPADDSKSESPEEFSFRDLIKTDIPS